MQQPRQKDRPSSTAIPTATSVTTMSSLSASPYDSYSTASHPNRQHAYGTGTMRRETKLKRAQAEGQNYVPPQAENGRTHLSSTHFSHSAQVSLFNQYLDSHSPFSDSKASKPSESYDKTISRRRQIQQAPTNTWVQPSENNHLESFQPLQQHGPLPSAIASQPKSPQAVTTDRWNQFPSACLDAATRGANMQHMRREWMLWDFVVAFLQDLPSNIRTLDLWENFSKEAEVDKIDIHVGRNNERLPRATIRFRPPPKRDIFASKQYLLKLEDESLHRISIHLDRKQNRNFTTASPVRPNVRYPETLALDAKHVDFGVLIAPEKMLIKTTKYSNHGGKVRMSLDLGRKVIDIRFPSRYSSQTRAYKFLVPFDEAFDFIEYEEQETDRLSFVLSLRKPPHFYKKLSDGIASTHEDQAFVWKEQDAWIRQTNVLSDKSEADLSREQPICLKNHPEGSVNIGRWTTYRITFDNQIVERDHYRIFRDILSDYNVQIRVSTSFDINRAAVQPWALLESTVPEFNPTVTTDVSSKPIAQDLADLAGGKNDIFLPFQVRYHLEVCISNGWINEYSITREFLRKLAQLDQTRAKQILEAVAFERERIFDPMDIFTLRTRRTLSVKNRVPDHCVLVYSAVVTPSSLVLKAPAIEMTNRVIRRYREHADRFLRVRFEDDEQHGFARLMATSGQTMADVFNKVFRTLSQGIVIGDRIYHFLAAGNSQFREHGAYFFAAEPNGPTADQIRTWMGQFQHERVVAKHAARIGQCFSTTIAIKTAIFPLVRESELIPDVKCIRRLPNGTIQKFNFTDGVGKISPFYAKTIARELGLAGLPPSVYQIRLGGCKGIVAQAPELKATSLKLRPSQYKFPTTYSGIEIIRYSEYWVATLNRQLILVLSALGVPDEVFLTMQKKELRLMETALKNDAAALQALIGHVDPNRMTLIIASFVRAGFRRANEPFVISLLRLWRAWSIKHLKEKAKLTVQEGAFILGCTDETATLRGHFDVDVADREDNSPRRGRKGIEDGECGRGKHGNGLADKIARLPQIFVQITCPQTNHRKVITGPCVIARNPSLHPGDIRVVNAVDVSALHHLADVVVLPQTGDRDLSSMCSGGDLDGDDYIVIWDQRLLPKIWNEIPMDNTLPDGDRKKGREELHRDVTVTDIQQFFVKYIKNDFLPKIARAHLAYADFLDDGIRHRTCLTLAQLHSKAVDYPKTGDPAKMPKSLNPKRWPHFMQKKQCETYTSHKILGRLYDDVKLVAFLPDYETAFDQRILKACRPSAEVLRAAAEVKREYDASIQRIMAQHDIKTEFEVWSTFVLDHSKASKDYKFHEEIGQLSTSIRKHYYDVVVEKAGGRGWTCLVPWAVAMYTVTRDELEAAKAEKEEGMVLGGEKLEDGGDEIEQEEEPGREVQERARKKILRKPLISFPWLLSNTLIEIVKHADSTSGEENANMNVDQPEAMQSPSMLRFNVETQAYEDPFQPGSQEEETGCDVEKAEPGAMQIHGTCTDLQAVTSVNAPGRGIKLDSSKQSDEPHMAEPRTTTDSSISGGSAVDTSDLAGEMLFRDTQNPFK